MKHWLFEIIDEKSPREGEQFFVCADTYHKAREIIEKYFPGVKMRFWHEAGEYEVEVALRNIKKIGEI